MTVPRQLPIFPLPDVVFFPDTVLPLHVFEMRYREMMKDALAGDRMIAVALLLPGWERNYSGSPACFPVATAGTIEDVQTTRDGRYYFKLKGAARVRLGTVLRDTPYRLVRVEESPEGPIDQTDSSIRSLKLDLLATQHCLARELSGNESQSLVLNENLSFSAAVNGVCAGLPVEAAIRQALLEESDIKERHRRASSILDELLRRVLALKSAAGGDERPSGAN